MRVKVPQHWERETKPTVAQILGPLPPPSSFQKAAAKDSCPPGRPPGVSSCLQPGIFLFFLLIQTAGFFCYVHFRWAFPWQDFPHLPSISWVWAIATSI